MLLDRIKSPKNLKRLSPTALETLAAEIRNFLVKSIADTGGHLSSNLGVVELTLALHKVFDSPKDKIIWDVGHQSYIHKIITGRKDRFHTLRKLDGLSGFPKINESEHDAFGTGHSSTSISAALGLAMARDLRYGENAPCGKRCGPRCGKSCAKREKVIAVIGDGSMTGGLAYEGLNNAGRSDTDLIVILNDNQMSICENVGAISSHLNDIRTGPLYLGAKQDVHRLLDKLPVVGPRISGKIESAKAALKYLLLHGVLFEEMGFRYFGPVDGHNIPALLHVLRGARQIRGPVLIHVLTKKGKGYESAEREPTHYHGIGAFNVNTGKPTKGSTAPSYTDVFSKSLIKKAARDKKIVAITAAMGPGTGLEGFKERFPKRFYDVGIAEGHAVTFAAGLAKGGLKPVVAVYASFLQRAYDQIIHDVALQNLPVIFAIDRAGLVGEDGDTHQGIYDLAYLSHIPNMTVLAPKDGKELTAMLDFALDHNGPIAIRYPRDTAAESNVKTAPILYGQSQTLAKGKGIALVSVGTMMKTALEAADILRKDGHDPSIYNARFIKPLDMSLVNTLAGYKSVFVLEDAARIGGYGTRLLEAMATSAKTLPNFHIFAFPDTFIEAGERLQLFKRYKLDPIGIAEYIRSM
ncbi:MAG: 1-deoxy-D-xylulose-5-phosphate synthase [Defluviitaleaceae bacterium]|nr:1-deoxy-D-xylulose-5-phosphate synthase [Defluviitaleaceae bacterium]